MNVCVTVWVTIDWIDGARSFAFPFAEFESRSASELDLVLNRLGVSENGYRRWLEASGRVRCMGTNKNGHPCKNHIVGLLCETPKEWLEAEVVGGYCKKHGGSK